MNLLWNVFVIVELLSGTQGKGKGKESDKELTIKTHLCRQRI
jgi:hypothetical protein